MNLLTSLGYTINVPKSHLTPSQMLPFVRALLDTVQFCAFSPKAESPGHLGYDPDVLASVLDLSEIDSEAAGTTGLLHPAGSVCQMAYVGSAVGSEVPVGTARGGSLTIRSRFWRGLSQLTPC